MTAAFGRFWATGTYRGADLMYEWLTSIGYAACHAEQRDWLACEWFERCGDDSAPPSLVLIWDARTPELEWVALAVPRIPPAAVHLEQPGLHRWGTVLVPAPRLPMVAAACKAHHEPPKDELWSVVTLDLSSLSPQALQTALLRLVATWEDAWVAQGRREPSKYEQIEAGEKFPRVAGWLLSQVAGANAAGERRCFAGTGYLYWTFNDFGWWGATAGEFVHWAESTPMPDHATFNRLDPLVGSALNGTFGWVSFYLASPMLEDAAGLHDEAMHRLIDLFHVARKAVPRWHHGGERWVRPLTLVADRRDETFLVRYRGPDDPSLVTDDVATNLLQDFLTHDETEGRLLLARLSHLVKAWHVH